MLLQDFRPRSRLVTKVTRVDSPRFSVIDAHDHLAEPFGGGWDHKPVTELLDLLDEVGITQYVDLDGGWGEEIGAHPDWAFTSPPFPSFMHIMDCFKNLVTRHRNTIFIGAHVGCYGEDLDWVGRMLDDCPNYYIDISARLGELGRQPYTARKFFIQYQDRILFGSDMGPNLVAYRLC